MGPNNVSAPGYRITLNGKEISREISAAVQGVTFEDELNLPAVFNIDWNMVDFKKSDWYGIDLDIFKPGDEIGLALGTDLTNKIMVGDITVMDLEFAEHSVMVLRGYDRMHRLRYGTKRRSFKNIKDSDLVAELAREAGLKAATDQTAVSYPYLFQNNQSNYQFLLERAGRLGYEMLVRDRTLYFRKSGANKAPVVKLEYGVSLDRFTVQLKALAEGSEVEVRGWDVKNKRGIVSKAGSGNEDTIMKGKESGYQISGKAFGDSPEIITDQAVISSVDADQLAKAKYNMDLKEFITFEGQCTGNTALRAGETVEIRGIGKRFSGVYYIVSTNHTVDKNGYVTTFQGKRTGI
jgi:phage protein D